MSTSTEGAVRLLGRVLISWIFLFSAYGQITDFSGNVQHVAASGMPVPQAAIVTSIVMQALCGLAVLLGFRIQFAALILFLFLIPTTLMLHKFWVPGAARTQELSFFKNLAIMGGLLFVATSGAGSISLDALLSRPRSSRNPAP